MASDAGHADRFPQFTVERWRAPVGCAVGNGGDNLAIGLGHATRDQHDAIIAERSNHRFIGIAERFDVGYCNGTSLPLLAVVITIDGCRSRWMMSSALAIGQPDRHDQAAAL